MTRRGLTAWGGLVACALMVLLWAPTASPQAQHEATAPDRFLDDVPGAARLEGRLLAPCCWDASRQTLDIHGSPIANDLRREIRTRLKGGESAEAIEADLVSRYGKKILAVPPGSPLKGFALFLSLAFVVAGAVAARVIWGWRQRGAEAAPEPGAIDGVRDEWDARLDAELADD